jgi:hypothetical protein
LDHITPKFFPYDESAVDVPGIHSLRSQKELKRHIQTYSDPNQIALEQQQCIPLKIRYALIVYNVGYGLFLIILALTHVASSIDFGDSCDLILWGKGCEVKVPFCQSIFTPTCDCAIVHLNSHNWTSIPPSIKEMKALQKLSLQYGPLTNTQMLESLDRLKVVDLSFNMLITLPLVLAKTGWKEIYLNNNRLIELPEAVCANPNILFVEANNNELTYIPQGIEKAMALQNLMVSNNSISAWPDGIAKLSIFTLALDGNGIIDVPKAIGDMKTLRELQLQNNKIIRLPNEFAELEKLRYLDLRNNSITSLDNVDTMQVEYIYLYGNPICITNSWNTKVRELVKSAEAAGIEGGCMKQCNPFCQNSMKLIEKCFPECNTGSCEYSWGRCST